MCLNPKDPEAHRIYTEGGGYGPRSTRGRVADAKRSLSASSTSWAGSPDAPSGMARYRRLLQEGGRARATSTRS